MTTLDRIARPRQHQLGNVEHPDEAVLAVDDVEVVEQIPGGPAEPGAGIRHEHVVGELEDRRVHHRAGRALDIGKDAA
jgi:hypothetical protein